MTHERDVVMTACIYSALQSMTATQHCVAVVGNDHVPGIVTSFSAAAAAALVPPSAEPHTDDAPTVPPLGASASNDAMELGVRRALLESMLRLQTQPAVLMDVEHVLGPVPDEHYEYYGAVYELYGTTQMLLACLGREELRRVCGGWRCDMWEALGAVRAVRPVEGGVGYAPELTLALRQRATVVF